MTVPENMPELSLDLCSSRTLVRELINRCMQDDARRTFVAVVGGSATGKTSCVVPMLMAGYPDSVTFSEDDYCIGEHKSAALHQGVADLYVPEDYDPIAMSADVALLRKGEPVEIPQYSFRDKDRLEEKRLILPSRVTFIDGCYLLQPHIRDIFDISVFIETDDHARFIRHFQRPRRGNLQNDASRIAEFCEQSYVCYYREIVPYESYADVIIKNPYSPSQSKGLVLSCDELYQSGDARQIILYAHPAMAACEELRLTEYQDGMQVLQYTADRTVSQIPSAEYRVSREAYAIDLRKIGYVELEQSS